MNVNRLRKIIAYSKKNSQEINSMIKKFCSFVGIDSNSDVLNIVQIARPAFEKKGYLVLEIPFADDEIGALCYKGDGLGYIVINTSLPKVNANFAIAHEIYHVFFQENDFISKVEFSNDNYYEHEDEYAANLFAGMLLMPETSFRMLYRKFKEESNGNEVDTIIRLMAYYQVPYMAVVIRCYELELPETVLISDELLNVTRGTIKEKFDELWLDENILQASGKDDYAHLESFVRRIGKEYVECSYINEHSLRKVLQNMNKLYAKIKGE